MIVEVSMLAADNVLVAIAGQNDQTCRSTSKVLTEENIELGVADIFNLTVFFF